MFLSRDLPSLIDKLVDYSVLRLRVDYLKNIAMRNKKERKRERERERERNRKRERFNYIHSNITFFL